MIKIVFFSDLSPQRQQLVELLQRTNFGRLEQLTIAAGEPQLRSVRVVTEWKMGSTESGPRPELRLSDYVLKTSWLELFELFDRWGDIVLDCIEVRHGLPFRVLVTSTPR